MFATVGGIMKAKGGKPKASVQEDMRAAEDKPLSSRMLVTSMLVLVFCLLMNQVGLFVPLVIMARNCALSKVPPSVKPATSCRLRPPPMYGFRSSEPATRAIRSCWPIRMSKDSPAK